MLIITQPIYTNGRTDRLDKQNIFGTQVGGRVICFLAPQCNQLRVVIFTSVLAYDG